MSDEQRFPIGRWLAIATVVALVVMWIYIFSGAARQDPPDTLNDAGFGRAAEPVCAGALAEVADLPPAGSSPSPADRADVLDEANAVLSSMLDDLGAIEIEDSGDRILVDLWLTDWQTFLGDRREFAEALRIDPDAELLVTARAGRQITLTIDNFAEVNDMASCVTPLDA